MATTTPKVSATTVPGPTSVANRVGTGDRASTTNAIDGVSGASASFIEIADRWRHANDDMPQNGGSDQGTQEREFAPLIVTPLVARAASGYPATEIVSSSSWNTRIFLDEMQSGIGIYEFNMRLTDGTNDTVGAVINRWG